MSDPLSNHDLERIRAALDAGRKIEAIRIYREVTGAGLSIAKGAVEAIDAGETSSRPAIGAASNDDIEAVEAAVFSGDRVSAIKIYRQATGLSLKEVKDFIDALEAELRSTEPERFTAPQAKGCGTAVLCLLGILGILLLAVTVNA